MHRSYVYFFILISIATTFAIPVTDCGSKEGKLKQVSLSCEGDTECFLKRGKNVTIGIQFIPLEDVPALSAVVHGVIEGVPVPFPLPNPDACVDSGLQCPLRKGNIYNYETSLSVKPAYPKVKLTVKWEMRDKNSEDIICILIPARIK